MIIFIFLVASDVALITTIIPDIVATFKISADDADLLVTGFMVIAASFLVIGGKLGDRVGARKTFLAGIVIYILATFICGAAPEFWVAVVGRLLQGFTFALAVPASMALLNHQFPKGNPKRAMAFSIWTTAIGAALAVGPLVGGIFAEVISWRWAFFVYLPIAVIALIGSWIFTSKVAKRKEESRFDVIGAASLVLAIGLLVLALQEAPSSGWWKTTGQILGIEWPLSIAPTPIFLIVGAVMAVFVYFWENRRERDGKSVVMGVRLLRIGSFAWGTQAAAWITAGLFGLLILLPIYAQYVLDYSPLLSGLTVAVMGFGVALGGPIATRITWWSERRLLIACSIAIPVGIGLVIPFIGSDATTAWLIPQLFIIGFAWGAGYAVSLNMSLADIPSEDAGVAGGTNIAYRFIISALATGLIAAVLNGVTGNLVKSLDTSGLSSEQKNELTEAYTYSGSVHPQLGAGSSVRDLKKTGDFNTVLAETKDDMATGVRWAIGLAGLLALVAVWAAYRMPKVKTSKEG